MPPMNRGEAKLAKFLEELRFGRAQIREDAAEELDDYKGSQAVPTRRYDRV